MAGEVQASGRNLFISNSTWIRYVWFTCRGVAVVTSESGQQSDLATGHQHTTSSAPFVCTQERLDRIKIHKLLRDPRRCRLPSSSSDPVLCTGFYQRPLFVVRFFVECARGQ